VAPAALGQSPPQKSVRSICAVRVNPGVTLDGVLDEDFWQRAERSGGFVQFQPDHGSPASESTFVRVAFDEDALYVGMEMYDSESERIISRLTRRDRWVDTDMVHVIVDSHHDHKTAYAFTVYASGTKRDVYYYNDDWSDDSWDSVWDASTRITDWGWTAEYRIPFSCLRFPCGDDPVWGIYFSRSIARKSELDRWVYIPEEASGFVSHFGHLEGLQGLTPPRNLEILPYGVSYAQTEPSSAGNPDGRDYQADFGFDAKYGVTSNLTLDATINPDFGQVEADQTVLNLSAFETWYPEKRPFFLEGSKIFDTYYDLFYSRRIGRPPGDPPDDVDYYIERPRETTILGAVKVTGKTGSGASIGLLESVTQREGVRFVDEDGVERTRTVEGRANYFAARLKQDILGSSSVGIMATAVNQSGSYPHYTGGLDWNLETAEGDYEWAGHLVGSSTGQDERGFGGMVSLEKKGGERFRGTIKYEHTDRELDLNRMGYLQRNNLGEAWVWLQYRTTDRWWIVRKSWNNLNMGYGNNLDGIALVRGGNVNCSYELSNFWNVGWGSWMDYDETYSDFETRGGPPAPIPAGQNIWVWVNTDSRRSWQAELHAETGDTWDGQYDTYRFWLEIRPRPNIEFSLGPSHRSSWRVSRWLKTLEDEDGNRADEIFGEEYMRRFDMTLRGTVTFTRDLTLQVYAQPFYAAVDYRDFKRLVPPRRYEYVDSSVYDEAEEEPDFNWTSFNSNVILRWEYRPGSTLYLVWAQSRDRSGPEGDFDPARDWDELMNSGADNTFLVKLNYWWTI
jgi:hypothetical protein